MNKHFKALFAISLIFGLVLTGSVLAQNNGKNDSKKPGFANYSATQVESMRREYSRLLGLIAKLQNRMNQNATSTVPTAADLACAQSAVATRETAVSEAFGTMSSCTNSALANRKNALAAAWTIAEAKDRAKAINQAWDDFKKASKACQTAYKSAVKSAWETFKTATKTCKAGTEEAMNEGSDLSLE
jgi:hypothetical protein